MKDLLLTIFDEGKMKKKKNNWYVHNKEDKQQISRFNYQDSRDLETE